MATGETTGGYLHGRKFVKSERHRPFAQINAFYNSVIVLYRPQLPMYVIHPPPSFPSGDKR
ncbi:hypothetical protein L873DRAFT_668789 [Choiromyces venosus 120613-1]|uniref:Uncharacterized protein n=1 Tax=Choiromyces venosus 120613-1 TaxID=1336337 RepID=A0A3N4IWJ4_9PEZI|nr:hypothetical protein L873DRAFT_668789 [Choiromyces venosus 120613-1]